MERTLVNMKNIKWRASTLALAGGCVLLVVLAAFPIAGFSRKTGLMQGPQLPQIQQLSRISSIKVAVSFVQEAKSESRLGTLHGIWLVQGDALLAIDMDLIQIIQVDDQRKTAVVRIPTPQLELPRIDHERTRAYDMSGNWTFGQSSRSSLQSEAMRVAERRVRSEAISSESVRMAKTQSELIIKNIYAAVGWEIKVDWLD